MKPFGVFRLLSSSQTATAEASMFACVEHEPVPQIIARTRRHRHGVRLPQQHVSQVDGARSRLAACERHKLKSSGDRPELSF
jgi:hypothetical protein